MGIHEVVRQAEVDFVRETAEPEVLVLLDSGSDEHVADPAFSPSSPAVPGSGAGPCDVQGNLITGSSRSARNVRFSIMSCSGQTILARAVF